MPYYCTVPRCTSMAGKAKNVSFHQFPRDAELAKLWNDILKRGKPYTKYSKVCSLHFKPDDYTVTSVGRNKGQWRTLRKDAVPSLNLPTDVSSQQQRGSSATHTLIDPQLQQQLAQAIYMQTMLAMQAAAGLRDQYVDQHDDQPDDHHEDQHEDQHNDQHDEEREESNELALRVDASSETEMQRARRQMSELERFLLKYSSSADSEDPPPPLVPLAPPSSYLCTECTKCFKDPDVFLIHKRSHNRPDTIDHIDTTIDKTASLDSQTGIDKQSTTTDNTQETLRANPILANLLRPEVPKQQSEVMTALAVNMEAYFRSVTSQTDTRCSQPDCGELNDSLDSARLVVDETA